VGDPGHIDNFGFLLDLGRVDVLASKWIARFFNGLCLYLSFHD
jgi:hypothetical protein